MGSAMGAMALTIGRFLGFYMGNAWTSPQLLIWILTLRPLITGIGSGPGNLLFGAGEFKTMATLVQRECILAVLLGVLLGMKWGMVGVGLGFLLSTVVGNFSPVFYAYAKTIQASGGRLMWQAWWRGLLACAISGVVAALLTSLAKNAITVVMAGAAGAAVALAVGAVTGAMGIRFPRRAGSSAPVAVCEPPNVP
jgi:O-antigen/teichoic acid export membrane protein